MNTNLKRGLTAAVVLVPLVILLVAVTSARGSAEPTAVDLNQQAKELRMKARRKDCETIATRITACYAGDRGACNKMTDSFAWFANEYGETPEVACPAEDSPFGAGGDGR